jgi:two-component system, chemotaxis family, CheB/CheR fusion protein
MRKRRRPRQRPYVIVVTYDPSKRLAGVRVLLLDDNTDCLDALRVLLEFNGAEVQAVASADDARATLDQQRPHVLISDLAMAGEDGFSFLASVRAGGVDTGRDTPALAFSAMSPFKAEIRATEVGFQGFLRKPGDVLRIVPMVMLLLPPALAL